MMACITLLAPPVAMTTTEFAHAIHCQDSGEQLLSNAPRQLCMNWVVVTDGNGHRSLAIRWKFGDQA